MDERTVSSGMADQPGAKQTRPTYADIEALPEHVVGEIIAGELVVSPRPAPRHAHATSRLGMLLGPPFSLGEGGPGGWWLEDEPELHLGDPDFEAVVPDMAGWRIERMPALPDTAWFDVVPDWVCEVLSPGTIGRDRAHKMPFYARAGVRHAWLIDPLAETLEAYAAESDRWVVLGVWRGSDRMQVDPFGALELPLGRLWEQSQGG